MIQRFSHILPRLLLVLLSVPCALPVVAGGIAPMHVEGATTIDVTAAKQLFDQGALFVDVRSDQNWVSGRIPDAVHLNNKDGHFTQEALAAEAGVDDPVVIYCNGEKCPRSSEAAKQAIEWGFRNINYFRDGLPAWQNAGYPVE